MKTVNKKGLTFYLYDQEDFDKYQEFKLKVKRDKKYFNVSNFLRVKMFEYLENSKKGK